MKREELVALANKTKVALDKLNLLDNIDHTLQRIEDGKPPISVDIRMGGEDMLRTVHLLHAFPDAIATIEASSGASLDRMLIRAIVTTLDEYCKLITTDLETFKV